MHPKTGTFEFPRIFILVLTIAFTFCLVLVSFLGLSAHFSPVFVFQKGLLLSFMFSSSFTVVFVCFVSDVCGYIFV